MDGIDAALLETDGSEQIQEKIHITRPYKPEEKKLLKAAERAVHFCQGDLSRANHYYSQALFDYLNKELNLSTQQTTEEITQLTRYLHSNNAKSNIDLQDVIQLSTLLHAQAVQQLLNQLSFHTATQHLTPANMDVIGYHGQTVFHKPEAGLSVQIGNGRLLAKLTGLTVVNDFRRCDILAGGQGAPFAPIYHQALAKRDKKIPLAVVNCGGIANISLIISDQLDNLLGFDTGPGNALIDALIRTRSAGQEFMDKDGRYGLNGVVHENVLTALFAKSIQQPVNYFEKSPPKSLDIRDLQLIPELDQLSIQDACKTLAAFSAESLVRALDLIELPLQQIPQHWILCGGGWNNPVILSEFTQRLHKKLQRPPLIQTADAVGWNTQAMEAQIFAYLAVRSLKNWPLSVPGTTRVPQALTGGHAYLSLERTTPIVQRLLAENPAVLHGYTH